MNKRRLSKLEQGQGTTVFGRLLLTRRQCRNLLKWVLLALGYLAVQVLQDVAISRVRLFGGCPDVTVAYLLLACVLLDPDRGGLFALWGISQPVRGGAWPGIPGGDYHFRGISVRLSPGLPAAAVPHGTAVLLAGAGGTQSGGVRSGPVFGLHCPGPLAVGGGGLGGRNGCLRTAIPGGQRHRQSGR